MDRDALHDAATAGLTPEHPAAPTHAEAQPPTNATAGGPVGGTLGRYIGALFLLQFAIVCAIKIHLGVAGEILWMSHIGLLIAAVGLLTRSTFLVGTATVSILLLHTMWLVDCLIWATTGLFPLNITRYLSTAGPLVWIATSHHFYLAPLLVVFVVRARTLPGVCLLGASCLYLVLTVISRATCTPSLNVNYSYGVLSSIRTALLDWMNLLPGPAYLIALNLGVTLLFFVPAFAGLRVLIRRRL